MPDRHLFACGGGGFAGTNRKMREAMIEACGKERPTVLFIPTASGDSSEYISFFKSSCLDFGLIPRALPLFDSQSWTATPGEEIEAANIIWVGGGSTFNMLKLWDAWGLVPHLRAAYDGGTVIGGVSAGAICWFEQGNTDSLGPGLQVLDCLGWIKGSCTPHYDSEALRKPVLAAQLLDGAIKPGMAIDEGCTVHLVNEQVSAVISDQEGANAYAVDVGSVKPLLG